jgi:dinuclear metal center YbgI/SA1388 family protein
MLTIQTLCDYFADLAPLDLAEDWDNVGLLVGDASRHVQRVMTCLTITPATMAEAIDERADLIVTHHPLPFRPLKTITSDTTVGRMLLQLIHHQVAVYSAHTAFDSARNGINHQLAEGLALVDVQPLCSLHDVDVEFDVGSGRRGRLPRGARLDKVAENLKTFLGLPHVRAVGPPDLPVKQVAIACGSAGQFLSPAQVAHCELLVTGETGFHTCLEAEATGMGLLLLGHFASERFAMEALAEQIAAGHADLAVWASLREADPLRLV